MIIHTKKNKQAGFTLIELLVVILIVGILAAVGLPMYLGYARDARMSEGKSLLGSLWTALRGCAQITAGSACQADDQFTRIGVGTDGVTPNGQWSITSTAPTVTLNASNQYDLSSNLIVEGVDTEVTKNLVVAFVYDLDGDPPARFFCSSDGTKPPTAPC